MILAASAATLMLAPQAEAQISDRAKQMFGTVEITPGVFRTDRCEGLRQLTQKYYANQYATCQNGSFRRNDGTISSGWAMGTTTDGRQYRVQLSDQRLNAMANAIGNPTADVSLDILCPEQAASIREAFYVAPARYVAQPVQSYQAPAPVVHQPAPVYVAPAPAVAYQAPVQSAPVASNEMAMAVLAMRPQRPGMNVTQQWAYRNQAENAATGRAVIGAGGRVISTAVGGYFYERGQAARRPDMTSVTNTITNTGGGQPPTPPQPPQPPVDCPPGTPGCGPVDPGTPVNPVTPMPPVVPPTTPGGPVDPGTPINPGDIPGPNDPVWTPDPVVPVTPIPVVPNPVSPPGPGPAQPGTGL